jgi:orotate phosphoribosyltransferase
MTNEEKLLKVAIERKALIFGKFKLSAGGESNYYFDGRLLTLDPEGAYLTAKCLIPIINKSGAKFIAGPTLGADPIVASVAAISYSLKTPISGLIVRKEAKKHGGKKSVEGPISKNLKVAVVDDTCTTGSSLFHAINIIEAEGCEVVKVLSIMDRMSGGSEECKKRGYDFQSIFTADKQGKIHIATS